jgi:rhamnosyltransferase
VCAVVVWHHPESATLTRQLAALVPQVNTVVAVDNTPASSRAGEFDGVLVLAQPENIGLASAQNLGIAWAREHGHTHVLLLDQDSVPEPRMVDSLLAALADLAARRPAAVGPVFRDPREHRDAPFVRVGFPMSKKVWCSADQAPVECDFLISSGALVPLAVLDDVGPMDDALFIDNVDLEWSFRARARGYRLFGVCTAAMEHHLGDARTQILGGRVDLVTHSPVRLYFIMRNRLTLYRLPHTPRVWIAQDMPRVLVKFVLFSVCVGPRRRNIRYMLRGLADGARGRLGPCSLGAA